MSPSTPLTIVGAKLGIGVGMTVLSAVGLGLAVGLALGAGVGVGMGVSVGAGVSDCVGAGVAVGNGVAEGSTESRCGTEVLGVDVGRSVDAGRLSGKQATVKKARNSMPWNLFAKETDSELRGFCAWGRLLTSFDRLTLT